MYRQLIRNIFKCYSCQQNKLFKLHINLFKNIINILMKITLGGNFNKKTQAK